MLHREKVKSKGIVDRRVHSSPDSEEKEEIILLERKRNELKRMFSNWELCEMSRKEKSGSHPYRTTIRKNKLKVQIKALQVMKIYCHEKGNTKQKNLT